VGCIRGENPVGDPGGHTTVCPLNPMSTGSATSFFLQNSKILVRQQSIKTKQNKTDNIFFLPSPW